MSGPELQLHEQVTGLAEILGWEWMHVRPMFDVKRKVYRTGTTGTLAKGWPDLFMVRARDRRMLYAELKGTKSAKPSPDQERVLEVLGMLAGDYWQPEPVHDAEAGDRQVRWSAYGHLKIEVHVWRPADWPEIEAVLR